MLRTVALLATLTALAHAGHHTSASTASSGQPFESSYYSCTSTGKLCGSSNSSAPACCGHSLCLPPPACGGPPPPTSPVFTCVAPSPPPPPGCQKEGNRCKADADCCQDACHDTNCEDGICRQLMPPTAMPTVSSEASTASKLNFTAWDRRNICFPYELQQPASVQQVVSIVRAAHAAARGQVKVYGAGHSFSSCALTDAITPQKQPVMINLDSLSTVLSFPTAANQIVSTQAGIRIHDLNSQLHEVGFALLNAGAIAEQSVAGATQTSTHGTGRELGSMSSQIVQLTMVLANGTVVTASATQNLDLFNAGRVGLGALGVVVELSLKVTPSFKLKRTTQAWDLNRLIEALPRLNAKYERLQWYWAPNTLNATLLIREPVPLTTPIGDGCWGAANLREMHSSDETECVDWSYKTLSHPSAFDYSRALYTEMEYFVPRKHADSLVSDFRAFQQSIQPQLHAACKPGRCSLFAGIRYVASDDTWLSMMAGEDIAVLSSIVTGPPDRSASGPIELVNLIDRGLERIAARYSGRPHWGKWHQAKQARLRSVYPRYDDFRAFRESVDPRGVFLNDWLRIEFGI